MKLNLFKSIAIPHIGKVAAYYLVSGGLMELLNNVASLHLSPLSQLIVAGIINALLAGLKKYFDASRSFSVTDAQGNPV